MIKISKKIKIKVLDSTGHSTLVLETKDAFNYCLENSRKRLIYNNELGKIYKNSKELEEEIDIIEELILIPQVYGG
ncbi:MAG: hypothetical protein GF329_00385 [Candidatus Lokiarchaeota archaeon]|nr:hypothetical protein [Candidatus Lokiarchaeota archaeon]